MRTNSGGVGGNCIAVVVGAHWSEENVPPVSAVGSGNGEFKRGFTSDVGEDRRAGKQEPAQGGWFHPLGLTEPALQADTQVVGADGEMTGRFGRPGRTAAQALPVCGDFSR